MSYTPHVSKHGDVTIVRYTKGGGAKTPAQPFPKEKSHTREHITLGVLLVLGALTVGTVKAILFATPPAAAQTTETPWVLPLAEPLTDTSGRASAESSASPTPAEDGVPAGSPAPSSGVVSLVPDGWTLLAALTGVTIDYSPVTSTPPAPTLTPTPVATVLPQTGGGDLPDSAAVEEHMRLRTVSRFGNDAWDNGFHPLIHKESNFNPTARNPKSSAGGIPQALPWTKMGCGLSFSFADVECQISWTFDYAIRRYGSPQAAWRHWQARVPIKGVDHGHWW